MDMPVREFAVADAKARFSELIARAEAGEEIVIKRHGAPVAKLVAVAPKMSVEERRRRRLEYEAWRDAHGTPLGPDLTIKDLINEGRR
jgi:prevent-host-death family protein